MAKQRTTNIIGHHRSQALAERHLRQLGPDWIIESRRRADGAYSERGHTFVFEHIEPPPPPEPVFEWIVSFSYNRSNRSFDVIVTAASRTDALSTAKEFLRADIDGSRIARSEFKNWSAAVARGNLTGVGAGNAEYRSKSHVSRKKRPT